jgi:transcriptional regulator with XRE-family HTH domain
MVHSFDIDIFAVQNLHHGAPALALRIRPMATTPVVCVDSREVVRCEHCRLMQYRTSNSLCRRCHKPLDIEEPLQFAPQLVTSQSVAPSAEAGLQVAGQVREIRRARHLSQRQLAGRMMVPRTYISKIENGKAIPTLGSLERLAQALGVDIGKLVHDSRSRRDSEVTAIFADPFLAEIAAALPSLDQLQRTILLGEVRDAATGRRRIA